MGLSQRGSLEHNHQNTSFLGTLPHVQSGYRPGNTKAAQTSKASATPQLGSTLPAHMRLGDPPGWDAASVKGHPYPQNTWDLTALLGQSPSVETAVSKMTCLTEPGT